MSSSLLVERLPCDVECPHCHRPAGWGCMNKRSYSTATHAKRWRAVGITEPTDAQLSAVYRSLSEKAKLHEF